MKDEHPYCSKWYTWPIMYRPVGYFFGTRKSINDPLPPDVLGSNESGNTVFYDVHGMGNPLLWWASFLALLTLLTSTAINTKALLIPKFSINTSNLKAPAFSLTSKQLGYEQVFVIYLLTAYFGSLLPWAGISRCAFIYSYMPSLIFALLGLAYVVDQLLNFKRWNIVGLLIIAGILFGFYYWLPNFLGLPMTNTEFYSRMWLGSWI
jgi:dolichyl-phosphate-mannose--protein O-mannosyl transferase